MTTTPEFLTLSDHECRDVLKRNHVGRLAFVRDHRVDIEPLGYVSLDDWIFLRSAHGTKLEALAHTPFVAFEVDEVRGPFDWRSVVVRGTAYLLPSDGAPLERRDFARAVEEMRKLVPETLRPGDPTPERQTVYGIHIDELTGRMAQSAPRAPAIRGERKAPTARVPRRRSNG